MPMGGPPFTIRARSGISGISDVHHTNPNASSRQVIVTTLVSPVARDRGADRTSNDAAVSIVREIVMEMDSHGCVRGRRLGRIGNRLQNRLTADRQNPKLSQASSDSNCRAK
jgi:acid phosphatase family membrane protein YuiD